jgi:phosphoribosylaminoimidazole-succinocarboxamide synthase
LTFSPPDSQEFVTESRQQATLRRGRILYEGSAKRVFETNDPQLVLLDFKSEFPQRPHPVKGVPATKPDCSALIAEHLFQYLNSFRIPNHFVARHGTGCLVVRKMEMIPVAVVIRNIAAGSFCAKYDVHEGREMEFPIIEQFYRNHQLDNPLVNESHIFSFGVATPEELRTMVRIATKTNAVLRSFLERRHLRLVDLWIEFGRIDGEVFIGDALTPDTMRLLDFDSSRLYDGSVFRLGIGDYADGYRQLCTRLLS